MNQKDIDRMVRDSEITERSWKKGPPPHIGWWNASYRRCKEQWSWWDGEKWSTPAYFFDTRKQAAENAKYRAIAYVDKIEWNDYYPQGARVPRVDPRDIK